MKTLALTLAATAAAVSAFATGCSAEPDDVATQTGNIEIGGGDVREADEVAVAPAVYWVALGALALCELGQVTCGNIAIEQCGAGNVLESKRICGAGYDLDGNWQIGSGCSVKCRPGGSSS